MIENSLDESRMNKLEFVRGRTNPYPERFEKTHELKDIIALEDGISGVRAAGRIVLMRKMGKLSFLTIFDVNGKVQIAIKKDTVGEEEYEFFKKSFDIGDFIGVQGDIFTTQTGEKTLRASKIYFLGKALRTLPEKFHGITNIDSCFRQRYLDLVFTEPYFPKATVLACP
jgi:lysyl-tRNA synthetase class 2